MELPRALRAEVDRLLENVPLSELRGASDLLSKRYRAETRDGRRHLDGNLALQAYLAARLPATYAVVRAAMEHVAAALPDYRPATILDIGSGPGTALWAANDCWNSVRSATLVEASPSAVDAGQTLSKALPQALDVRWLERDVRDGFAGVEPAELVTAAYVLDELEPAHLAVFADSLWELAAPLLLIVEPGTPAGYRRIIAVRKRLIARGGFVAAPCPHEAPCPLVAPDWCHFAQRVARSRIHRLTKDADAPWEDEKFSYVALSRAPPPRRSPRVLAPPAIASGRVTLKLCEPDGHGRLATFSRRQGDVYRSAKRVGWGDTLTNGE